MTNYDVVVIGLGGMGSAALAHLASRGLQVIGLEQFHPAHALGSSHGGSRIIRKAYYEDPAYVPLLLRAYELWRQLEADTGANLLLQCGGLMAGYEGCEILQGSLRSARKHNLAHEVLSAADIKRRFPVLYPTLEEMALYEPDAGVLFPEACVLAHLQMAVAAGAEVRFGTPVQSWEADSNGVSVTVGDVAIRAERLVICAGPWLAQLMADLELPLMVERNVMHWFEPSGEKSRFGPKSLPIYVLERRDEPIFYGTPWLPEQGLKAAYHYSEQFTTPQAIDRTVQTSEIDRMRQALTGWIPEAAASWRDSRVCMYTNTPDKHFVIGAHPRFPQVVFAGGFSGHGFKFCSVVGEILADLAAVGSTRHAIELFAPRRFA